MKNERDFAISGESIQLTDNELSYLYRIGNSRRPAGIIDNNSSDVLLRNRASLAQLDTWGVRIKNSSPLWQPEVLDKIKRDIFLISEGESFEREYQLSLPKIGLIFLNQRFTKVIWKNKICRMFEQIDCRVRG